MVEVKGKPLLQWAVERLISAGSEEIIINVHHFADLVIRFLQSKNNFGVRIEISDERQLLLETGGGLKKARWFFDCDAPFLVCNVDVLTNLDLALLYQTHLRSNALATLAVRDRSSSRYLLFDQSMHLQGWKNEKTGETRPPVLAQADLSPLAFSGIQVLSPAIFDYMPEEDKFSIIDVYLRAMKTATISGFTHDQDFWLDVGKPAALAAAQQATFF